MHIRKKLKFNDSWLSNSKQLNININLRDRQVSNSPRQEFSRNTAYNGYIDNFLNDSDSVLNFKMMVKSDVSRFKPQDFKIIEDAIVNLEISIPCNQKRSKSTEHAKSFKRQKLVTQKQALSSLENSIYHSKIYKKLKSNEQSHLKRMMLKVHNHLQEQGKKTMPMAKQVEIMLKYLIFQISKIETKVLADSTYKTCLMQKTFISLLSNMTENQIARQPSRHDSIASKQSRNMNIKTCSPRLNTHQSGQDVTFRLSKHEHNDDYQENINQEILKNISEQEFKKDLMSGETILSSPAKNEQLKIQRMKEKESSPVRNFLDDDSMTKEAFQGVNKDNQDLEFILHPEMIGNNKIQESLMFEDNQIIEGSINTQMIVNSQETRLLSNMQKWRQQALEGIHEKDQQLRKSLQIDMQEKEFEQFAKHHYLQNLKRKVFSAIIIEIVESNEQYGSLYQQFCMQKNSNLIYLVLQGWRAYTNNRKVSRQIVLMKMDKSEGLHQFNLKQKAFHALNDKLNERRLLALQLLNKYMVKKNWKTKSKYFKTFKKIIKNKKFQKQRADDFHILCLLSKGIRGFKHNKMNLKQEIISKGRKVKDYRIRQIFSEWRKKSQQNLLKRVFEKKIQDALQQSKCHNIFNQWRDLVSEIDHGRNIRNHLVQKKVIFGIQKYCQIRKRKQLVTSACISHISILRLKIIFDYWKNSSNKQKDYRQLQIDAYYKMDLLRQRQVFKQWFNQIDVLKRWKYIEMNTAEWYQRKRMGMIFKKWQRFSQLHQMQIMYARKHQENQTKYWFSVMKKAALLEVKYKVVYQNQNKALQQKLFREWLQSLVSSNTMKKCKFVRNSKSLLKRSCFYAWKKYLLQRRHFKMKIKDLLRTRALNLMKLSYVGGLKFQWHKSVMFKNLWKASGYMNKARLIKSPFRKLKAFWVLQTKFKQVNCKYHHSLRKKCLKFWLKRFYINDESLVYCKERHKKLLRLILQNMKIQIEISKDMESRSKEFAKVHQFYVTKRAIRKLRQNPQNNRKRVQNFQKLKKFIYHPYLMHTAFQNLVDYSLKKQKKRQILQNATKRGQNLLLNHIIQVLKSKVKLNKSLKVLSKDVQSNIKFNCMLGLKRNATLAKLQKKMNAKVNQNMKKNIFEFLKVNKKVKLTLRDNHDQLMFKYVIGIYQRAFISLKMNKERRVRNRLISFQIISNKKHLHVREWKELVDDAQNERVQRHKAQMLYIQHIFYRLRYGAKQFKDEVGQSMHLSIRRREFWEHNSKRRALHSLFKNMNNNKLQQLQQNFTNRVVKRKFFNAWYGTIDIFKRKRILQESANIMIKSQFLEKSFMALAEYAENKGRTKSIIQQFCQRRDYNHKSNVIMSLHQNIIDQKTMKAEFYNKIAFVARKRLQPAFTQWVDAVNDQLMEEKADEFYNNRKMQFLSRLTFDSLIVNCLNQRQKHLQHNAIAQWYGKILKQRVMLSLKSSTYQNQRINNISSIIGMKTDNTNLRQYFDLFKRGIEVLRQDKHQKNKSMIFVTHNVYRKCLIAIQLYMYNKQRLMNIQVKNQKRTEQRFMRLWRSQLSRAQKIEKFTDILQNQVDCRLVRKFLPNLASNFFHLKIGEHITNKRITEYQREFIHQLQKQILQRKIQKSFNRKRLFELKKTILIELRIHAMENKRIRRNITDHLNEVEQESNLDILQIAFNSLKEKVVIGKFKAISTHCNRLKTCKKVFFALQEFSIKSAINRGKIEEIRRIQEAKYLWHWRKAYIMEKQKQDAVKFVEGTLQHQIIWAWRKIAEKQIRAKAFAQNVVKRNQMSHVFTNWAAIISRKKELKRLQVKMEKMHEQNTRTIYMYDWIQIYQEFKICKQMDQFYALKRYKDVFPAWRKIKDQKNQRRRNIYHIREKLKDKPELGRPLLVLKNFLLFKAFNKLVEGVGIEYDEAQMNQMAKTQYYVTYSKKAFLCLKLNAQLGVQKDNVDEISELFLKRRWLNYIKMGTVFLRERRKLRHKASIFRFLAVQRKAFSIMVQHTMERQEIRIKKQFALQLYYKRVLDTGFSSLKIYREYRIDKKEQRELKKAVNLQTVHHQKSISSIQEQVDEETSADFVNQSICRQEGEKESEGDEEIKIIKSGNLPGIEEAQNSLVFHESTLKTNVKNENNNFFS